MWIGSDSQVLTQNPFHVVMTILLNNRVFGKHVSDGVCGNTELIGVHTLPEIVKY